MVPQNNLPNPAGGRPQVAERGFDLHRAYRAIIREILRREMLKRSATSVAKEEPHG